ncbi:Na+-translocating ferredoxin:NAD+ oxidoreductase RnfC subunit [Pseudomonas sp. TE3786]
MENQPAKSAIVTLASTCMKADGHALLTVNAGVPVELTLEQAGYLLDCIECLVLNRENLKKTAYTNSLHYLTDLTRALVTASYNGLSEYERTLQ